MRYSDIKMILQRVFKVSEADLPAFTARLNTMRRPATSCVPGIKHEGKGKQITYDQSDLRHLMLAFHLNLLGLEPRLISSIYKSGMIDVDECFNIGERDVKLAKSNDGGFGSTYEHERFMGFLSINTERFSRKRGEKPGLDFRFFTGWEKEVFNAKYLEQPGFTRYHSAGLFINFTTLAAALMVQEKIFEDGNS